MRLAGLLTALHTQQETAIPFLSLLEDVLFYS